MLHRANRILMMAVLILLSLVLITTSVVSGIFAKYTLTRSIGLNLGFERLGIKVDIELSEEFVAATERGDDVNIDGGIQIVIKDFKMKPGDKFEDALKLTVEGSPIETAIFSVEVAVRYSDGSFLIPAETFKDIQTPTYCMPIGFIAGTYDAESKYTYSGYAVNPYSYYDGDRVAQGIAAKVGALTTLTVDDTNKALTNMTCAVDTPITFGDNISAIGFGFEWPKEYDASNSDELGTWISNQGHSFDIIYTIRVEQGT